MDKLGIYIGLPKYTPKLSHSCRKCIISKETRLYRHPNVSTEKLYPGTCFHLEFRFSNKVSCQKITSALTIFDNTTSHLFGYPTRSKRPPIQLINTFIQFSCHNGYKITTFLFDEVVELSRSTDFM